MIVAEIKSDCVQDFNTDGNYFKEVESHSYCKNKSLEWWVFNYPTLELAKTEVLRRSNDYRNLKISNCENLLDYISKLSMLDYDIMMLEMTIEELHKH